MAPKGESSMVGFVRARCELVDLNLRAGVQLGSDQHANLSSSTVSSLRSQLQGVRALGADVATECLKLVLDAQLLDATSCGRGTPMKQCRARIRQSERGRW